ncbi:MAG: hypothetical protein QM756_17745 [Polyangiaceae bacterium]
MKIAVLLRAAKRSLGLAWLLVGAVAAACSSGNTTCNDAQCDQTQGQRCVQNACRPPCEDQDGCPTGQNCVRYGFVDGSEGQYCAVLDYAKDGRTGHSEACSRDDQCDELRSYKCREGTCQRRTGQFEPCQKDEECDQASGFVCLAGECRIQCSSHFDCAPVGTCESLPQGTFCKVSTPAKAGQYYTRCPFGDADCDTANGFSCAGSGAADLEAFCTADCKGQSDCPDGYRCGAIGATPCADQCGVVGQQTTTCVQAADIGAGKRYQCAEPFGLIRRVCVRNGFCTACEKDEDCLTVAGQICAKDKGGNKICTTPCDPSVPSCPWGDATECGVWDSERGIPTCAHRFGACKGTGKGCEPCVDTGDCGAQGYCTRSSFTGERFCVDLTVSCNCGSDADASGSCEGHGCGSSPGGLPLLCSDSSLGKLCFGANSATSLDSQRTGCWPP